MKRFLSILVVLFSLFSCKPAGNPSATATIKCIFQDHFSTYYKIVEVYYDITNTGDYNINTYIIFYIITCMDGTIFNVSSKGSYLNIEETRLDYSALYTSGKQYKSVVVSRVECEGF